MLDGRVHAPGLLGGSGPSHPGIDVHVREHASIPGRVGAVLVPGSAGPLHALPDARRLDLSPWNRPAEIDT